MRQPINCQGLEVQDQGQGLDVQGQELHSVLEAPRDQGHGIEDFITDNVLTSHQLRWDRADLLSYYDLTIYKFERY